MWYVVMIDLELILVRDTQQVSKMFGIWPGFQFVPFFLGPSPFKKSPCPENFFRETKMSHIFLLYTSHSFECSNAICSYPTLSKFSVCYVWFCMNVVGSRWGICFVMLAELWNFSIWVLINKKVCESSTDSMPLIVYAMQSAFVIPINMLCKCTTLFLNLLSVNQNTVNAHLQEGLM